MGVGLGVDQLGVDTDLVARPPDAAFEDIAHTKIASDLLGIDPFVLVSERVLFAMRDKLVITSSVIPSAKYCWSGSLLRLVNGNTTIDRRGATRGGAIDVAATAAGVGAGLVAGQSHQAPTAMTSSTGTAAPTATRGTLRRRRAPTVMAVAGRSAMAAGRSAYTWIGCAMFLTVCSPLSSSG
jgi:hypothetical protein